MTFRNCPHDVWIIECKTCNSGPICIHGDIKDMCKNCNEIKSDLKQSLLYNKVCSALEKTLPHPLSKLIPKNERQNTTQGHIHSLSKGSRIVNSLP